MVLMNFHPEGNPNAGYADLLKAEYRANIKQKAFEEGKIELPEIVKMFIETGKEHDVEITVKYGMFTPDKSNYFEGYFINLNNNHQRFLSAGYVDDSVYMEKAKSWIGDILTRYKEMNHENHKK